MRSVCATALWVLAAVLPAAADPPPLICFGNEPSWSVDLTAPGTARLALPDQTPADFHGGETRLDPLPERAWRGVSATGAGDLVAFLSETACSDGMSDRQHPVTARISLPGGRLLAGCCRAATTPASVAPAAIEGPTWRLISLPGQDAGAIAGLAQGVTARFGAGRLEGFAGCNRYAGTYRIEGDRVTVGPVAGTMMACPDPGMAVENAFRAALTGTFRYTVAGERLSLTADSGAALAFRAEPPPQLEGVVWEITGLNNGRHAVVSLVAGTTLTLSFGDAVLSGHAGCNTFRARYSRQGDRVAIGPVAATRRACAGGGVMDQEREFLAALESAVVWRVEGSLLDMHRADDERALTARARTR